MVIVERKKKNMIKENKKWQSVQEREIQKRMKDKRKSKLINIEIL